LYAFNLDEATLKSRFIGPYERAEPITWSGRTLPGGDINYLKVFESDPALDEELARRTYQEFEAITAQREVTNTWVTSALGSKRSSDAPGPARDDLEVVKQICQNLGRVARQLQRRRGSRPTIVINDEYDAQDLLHALLLTAFDDVRAESWNPTYLGGASRIDFLLPGPRMVVEVKMTRQGHADRQIGSELAEDVTRYSDPHANRGASLLVCFIYDPDHHLANPRGIERDLATASNERLRVVGIVGS